MLYYYMPSFEVSNATDAEWVYAVAALLKIRKLESKSS